MKVRDVGDQWVKCLIANSSIGLGKNRRVFTNFLDRKKGP